MKSYLRIENDKKKKITQESRRNRKKGVKRRRCIRKSAANIQYVNKSNTQCNQMNVFNCNFRIIHSNHF